MDNIRFPSIEQKKIKDYRKLNLARRDGENEVESMTVLYFDDMEALKAFAGEDYEKSYIPPEVNAVLFNGKAF